MSLELRNAEASYNPDFIAPEESKRYYESFLKLDWKIEDIIVYGKPCKQNRYTCFYGTQGKTYRYSGIKCEPIPWTPELLEIKQMVEDKTGLNYDVCLLNYYKDGTHNLGSHSDNERDLVKGSPIVSISLGAERFFDIQHKFLKNIKKRLVLKNGSLLVMGKGMQKNYKHGIPKQMTVKEGRINLTFRCIS
jgi:alkylated DNA repair dioxygenase AlkB